MIKEFKIKQITNSTHFDGKEYILAVTECGKLLEGKHSPTSDWEWTIISVPKPKKI